MGIIIFIVNCFNTLSCSPVKCSCEEVLCFCLLFGSLGRGGEAGMRNISTHGHRHPSDAGLEPKSEFSPTWWPRVPLPYGLGASPPAPSPCRCPPHGNAQRGKGPPGKERCPPAPPPPSGTHTSSTSLCNSFLARSEGMKAHKALAHPGTPISTHSL